MAKSKKRPVIHLRGAATATAKVVVEARITDSVYEAAALTDDIRTKRAWLEGPPDDEGWMKLLYSADGPTGDPIPVGKVRITLDPDALDPNFGDLSGLTIGEAK
jgi:hypothetical protein